MIFFNCWCVILQFLGKYYNKFGISGQLKNAFPTNLLLNGEKWFNMIES